MLYATLAKEKNSVADARWIEFPLTDDILTSEMTSLFNEKRITNNCYVSNVEGNVSALKCLIGETINVDELNYLAKRLDSFWGDELPKFNAVVDAENLTSMQDLINLTFNFHNYTLVTDFSDLEKIGYDNYMDIHQCISVADKETMDFESIGKKLIESVGEATVYGALYCNKQETYEVYNGTNFPAYAYTSDFVFAVGISLGDNPDQTEWLYLPCSDVTIEKALNRLGVTDSENLKIEYDFNLQFPESCFQYLNPNDNLETLNNMCAAIKKMDGSTKKLEAVVEFAQPNGAVEIEKLANRIDMFDFVEGVTTYEKCGKHFAYSDIGENGLNLDNYLLKDHIDYESFGKAIMSGTDCGFTSTGYVEC